MSLTRLTLAAVAAALVAVPAAGAHVTVSPRSAPADGYAKLDFSVPHGCDGSSTTRITVQIPPGVVSVKPQVVAGWEIETTTGPYDEPVELHGQTITEGVTEVTWRGGPLPDEHLQVFGLSVKLPDRAGETIWFPVVQECEQGETRWIEIPEAGQAEPDHPAAGVELTAAGDGHGSAPASDEEPASDGDAATTDGDAASDEPVSSDGGEAASAPEAGEASNDRANLALGLGGAGLVAGLAGLGLALTRRPRP